MLEIHPGLISTLTVGTYLDSIVLILDYHPDFYVLEKQPGIPECFFIFLLETENPAIED